jgi:hypothetical protein
MMEVEATSELLLPDGRPVGVMNSTTIATGNVVGNREVQKLVGELGSWIEKSRQRTGDKAGMFNRSLYQPPDSPYDQMRVARTAVREDDIVSGVADATEALAFDGGLKWESSNPDDADVFNQLSADINLDGKIREMWREVFTVDQFVSVKLWDNVKYTVRGKTDKGNKKKKTYEIYAPTQLTLLRPENVVPIGFGPLRKDELAWQATPNEIGSYNTAVYGDEDIDPLMRAFFTGQYTPGPDEKAELSHWGVNVERLLKMNPKWVFRHTSTRPDYQKFPDLRMRGVFNLLDLKRQLIASDRATLIGAANYILLIRKGSPEQPGTTDEINNLKQNYNFLAKLPVIISDHRLEIDVIAPKLDFVLKKEAYDALDARLLARLLSTFVSTSGGRSAGPQAADSFTNVLASALQNRRHMIKRSLERELSRAVVDHPQNKGLFEERPTLVFTPRNVTVGTNQALLTAMLALRTQREISRDTILEYMGLDEATEAQRMELEEKLYDDIFKTQIPFAAPGAGGAPGAPGAGAPAQKAPAKPATPNGTPESPKVSGARGGRPTGGGSPSQSPQATTKPKSASGNPSTKK